MNKVMKRGLVPLILLGIAGAAALAWLLAQGSGSEPVRSASAATPAELAATDRDMKVYKTPNCGCCTDWVHYMEDEGFTVEAVDVSHQELNVIKQKVGLSRNLASCHTAFVDGYVVEGHVPAADVRRLLAERPEVTGLSVPGMPIGSPGMEMGDRYDPYHVVTFDESGGTDIFSSYHQ